MQQRRAQRGGVEPHAGADLGDADRVDDEVLAAGAALVGVAVAGEHERLLDELAVDPLGRLVGVLLDDREEVAKQNPLVLGQPRPGPHGGVAGVLVDRMALEVAPVRGALPRGVPSA